jgi:tRNA(Ile)-lysidine synthase
VPDPHNLTGVFYETCGAPPGSPIGIALSGGSDSIALLHMAANWSKDSGVPLIALTVDHRLRAASADEARFASAVCARLGVAHRTLVWDSPKPQQAAARLARHSLLAAAMAETGGHLLLLGHTADDQVETHVMRAARSSTPYGLAGMRALDLSPVPVSPVLWIGRPLLFKRRRDLQEGLRRAGFDWIEDPSNLDEKFERVRVRQQLARSPEQFSALLFELDGLAASRRQTDQALGRWLEAQRIAGNSLRFSLETLSPDQSVRALSLVIRLLAPRASPPRLSALAELLTRLNAPDFAGTTLGRVWFQPQGNSILARLEAGHEAAGLAGRFAATHILFTMPDVTKQTN